MRSAGLLDSAEVAVLLGLGADPVEAGAVPAAFILAAGTRKTN